MRSILQLGLMVLLLGAGNRLWGKVAVGQTIAERGFVESAVFVSVVDAPPVLMSAGEAAARGYNSAGFVDGPNVYAYVKQNPWTSFDPHGLWEMSGEDEEFANYTGFNPRAVAHTEAAVSAMGQDLKAAARVAPAVVKTAALSCVPGVGEGMDVAVLNDPKSTPTQRFFAQASLMLSVATDGLTPNAGAIIRSKNAASESAQQITRNNARQLLRQRGFSEDAAAEIVNSFAGKRITATQGKAGDALIVTESSKGSASGLYTTRESAGATPGERQRSLALPDSNKATVETPVVLTKDQVLLEGPAAPKAGQPGFPQHAEGGHNQVVTDGGRRSGAVKDKEK